MSESPSSQDENLFPNKKSIFVFWSYISLFSGYGILVKAVERSKIYGFNAPIIVLLVELLKLCICVAVYLLRSQGNGWTNLLQSIKSNQKLLLLYMVPAFLYCLYNNLTFVNLSLFDVSTYYCLMQFRIVLTAVIYQILFKRQLNLVQWSALMILTAGCFVKQYGDMNRETDPKNDGHDLGSTEPYNLASATTANTDGKIKEPSVAFIWSSGLILFQMFCSCFAGVYNEYLLKDSATAHNADVILQNIFMYFDSIICNVAVFVLTSSRDVPEDIGLGTILWNLLTSPLALLLILNSALAGLVASLFLKSLNSILKTFASAIELLIVTYLAWLLFREKVNFYTILALYLVSLATIIYSRNPVSVAPPKHAPRLINRDGFVLVPMNND